MGRAAVPANVLLIATVLVFALLAAACASVSDSAAPSGQTSSEVQNSTTAVGSVSGDDPAPEPATTTEPISTESNNEALYVSLIGEALGIAQDQLSATFNVYVNNAEELVRTCMAERGFTYTPVVIGFDQQTRQAELQATLPPEQFTADYGFGIATLFELNFKDQGVIDFVNQQFGPPPTSERSPGEQDAHEIALNGVSTQGLTPEEAQAQLFDGADAAGPLFGSCRYCGYSAAENPGAVYDGLLSLLGDELDVLTDRFDNDPRIRNGWSEWQTCMATNGHSYDDHSETFDELFADANDLANQYLSSPQILTALSQAQQQGFVSMDGDARAAFLEDVGALQGFSWVPEVQAEYDELVTFELLVAADSQDCLDEDLFSHVQFELETEFVQSHADQLALLAAGDA